MYWTIATMTSTGYGDVSAHTVMEMVYASFVMVVGKLMFGFILANIASTLSNAGVYRVQYDLQIQSVRVSSMKWFLHQIEKVNLIHLLERAFIDKWLYVRVVTTD